MNISLVNNSNYRGVGSCLLHLQPEDLLGENPTVSRSTIEDALSHMRVQSKYRQSIVEKILSDPKASAIAKVLNFWVKVYIDISVLVHSDMEDGMNSNMEEEDIERLWLVQKKLVYHVHKCTIEIALSSSWIVDCARNVSMV